MWSVLPGLGTLLGWETLQFAQSQVLYKWGEQIQRELHVDAKAQNSDIFQKSYRQAAVQHRQSIKLDLKLYQRQRKYEKELAERERRRDIWQQKSSKVGTLMMVDTLLFSCILTIITQGMPPDDSGPVGVVLFAIFMCISFFSLLCSLSFALILSEKLSRFNIGPELLKEPYYYECGFTHIDFQDFYDCHCKPLSTGARYTLWIGAYSMTLTTVLLMYLNFDYDYMVPQISLPIVVGSSILSFILIPVATYWFSIPRPDPERHPEWARKDSILSQPTARRASSFKRRHSQHSQFTQPPNYGTMLNVDNLNGIPKKDDITINIMDPKSPISDDSNDSWSESNGLSHSGSQTTASTFPEDELEDAELKEMYAKLVTEMNQLDKVNVFPRASKLPTRRKRRRRRTSPTDPPPTQQQQFQPFQPQPDTSHLNINNYTDNTTKAKRRRKKGKQPMGTSVQSNGSSSDPSITSTLIVDNQAPAPPKKQRPRRPSIKPIKDDTFYDANDDTTLLDTRPPSLLITPPDSPVLPHHYVAIPSDSGSVKLDNK